MNGRVSAPFIHSKANPRLLILDVLLACIPLVGMAVFFYGGRILLACAVSVGAAVLSEYAVCLALRRKSSVGDWTALVTGLFVALLCPPSVPLLLPAVGSVFAIVVVKFPFGGRGRNLFNPAAAGFCFLVLSAPGILFTYPEVSAGRLPWFGVSGLHSAPSLTALLRSAGALPTQAFELLLGRYAAPIGGSFALVTAACGLYLIVRRVLPAQTLAGFLLPCILIALLVPRGSSPLTSVLLELCSGSLLFCAFFLAADPSSSAKTNLGRFLFGLTAGTATMLFRYFGVYEQGAPFGILLANAFVPVLDSAVKPLQLWLHRRGPKEHEGRAST